MDPLPVVKELDVIKQVGVDFFDVTVVPAVNPFLLQLGEEALDARIVVRTPAPRHAAAPTLFWRKK